MYEYLEQYKYNGSLVLGVRVEVRDIVPGMAIQTLLQALLVQIMTYTSITMDITSTTTIVQQVTCPHHTLAHDCTSNGYRLWSQVDTEALVIDTEALVIDTEALVTGRHIGSGHR